MARRNRTVAGEPVADSGIFQKIGMLGDLTNAVNNKDLQAAFQELGANGNRLFEIFADAVYEEIEFLMKGEQEEAPAVMADAAAAANQIYSNMHNLYSMMVSLSNSPAMQALNLIADRMTGQSFTPGYNQPAPQPQYQPPQYQPPAYQPPHQPQYEPEPQYEAPQPPPQAPRPQQRQPAPQRPAPAPRQPQQPAAPQAPQPQPAPQQPRRAGRYGNGQQAAPQQPAPQQAPGPAPANRPAAPQGHGPAAPGLPPRRNRVTGLF